MKNSLFFLLNIIPYNCFYRNVIPQNLNSLLRLVVAKWTFAVWFHAHNFVRHRLFKKKRIVICLGVCSGV